MLFGIAFVLGAIGGFIGAAVFHVFMSRTLTQDLKDSNSPLILDSGAVRPPRRRGAPAKHIPKANTDLIAFQKEIEEQGANRV